MESPHKPQKPTCVCVCVCVCLMEDVICSSAVCHHYMSVYIYIYFQKWLVKGTSQVQCKEHNSDYPLRVNNKMQYGNCSKLESYIVIELQLQAIKVLF